MTTPPIKISDEAMAAAGLAAAEEYARWNAEHPARRPSFAALVAAVAQRSTEAVTPLIAVQVLPADRAPLFAWIPTGFTMHSGGTSHWKIECDSLSAADWETLARIVADRVEFGSVEGVPRGGLPFAAALEPFAVPGGPLLIVDDVWTTGRSMEAHRAGRDALGIVAFARAPVSVPWVRAMFTAGDLGVSGGTQK